MQLLQMTNQNAQRYQSCVVPVGIAHEHDIRVHIHKSTESAKYIRRASIGICMHLQLTQSIDTHKQAVPGIHTFLSEVQRFQGLCSLHVLQVGVC